MAAKHILLIERWKFVFYAGLVFLISPFRDCRKLNSHPKRILVVPILTRVGDLVCATPVFRAIKEKYPNSHLSVIVGKKVIELIKSNPRIDEIINLNDIPFKGFWGRGRLFKFIFDQKFDAVISLTNNPFNNLVAAYSFAPIRAKTVVAFRSKAEIFTDWLNNWTLEFKTGSFLQDHYIYLLKSIGVDYSLPVKEIFVINAGEVKADNFFQINNLAGSKLVVGVSLSAGHATKEWPRDYFIELLTQLVNHYDAKVVLIDSASNLSRVNDFTSSLSVKVKAAVSVATEFSLSEVASLIKRLKMFIAVDTGLIYIANALGVPLIDIVGPVHPKEQPPSDQNSILVMPPAYIKPRLFVLEAPRQDSFEKAREAVYACTVPMVISAFVELIRRNNIVAYPGRGVNIL